MQSQDAHLLMSADYKNITGHGLWTVKHLKKIETNIHTFANAAATSVTIDMSTVSTMDSAGALLLETLILLLNKHKKKFTLVGLTKQYTELLHDVEHDIDQTYKLPYENKFPNIALKFGKWIIDKSRILVKLVSFIGEIIVSFYHIVTHPTQLSFRSVAAVFHNNCNRAMPIVALLNFLVGIVITYQMGLELKSFSMNILIVNLSGVIMFREFAPLMTAIIASGRTSTSFTAQIGAMIVNEEVDALRTMGVNPVDVLVIPKLIGILIAFPLLLVWADFFAMLGGIIVAKIKMGIGFNLFLETLYQSNPVKSFLIGLLKTPFFAVLVTTIGCFHGFSAKRNAVSIGAKTTQSAVQSLFFIIVLNSIFSIVFTWGNL